MGRPREFDIDKAIEKATNLFWRNGYDGTSLSDLTQEIGITPPSFYFAFGSKIGLFKRVIERYNAEQGETLEAACQEPTVGAVAARLLHSYADVLTDPGHPPGCLAMNSALPCTEGDSVRTWLADMRERMRVRLRDRFAYAKSIGDLTQDSDPDALARLVTVIAWGLAVEAQSGTGREELHQTVDLALAGWPRAER